MNAITKPSGLPLTLALIVPLFAGAVAIHAACMQQGEQGDLEILARDAKAAGKKEAVFSISPDNSDASDSTEEYLKTKSVVVGTPTRPPVVVRKGSDVVTLHVMRIEQTLRTGQIEPDCSPATKAHGQRVRPGSEIVVAIGGGAVTIDGIRVIVKAFADVDFAEGASVLVVGWNCGGSAVELMHGPVDIFDVSRQGVVAYRGLDPFPFAEKFKELRTVPAIAAYLKSLR